MPGLHSPAQRLPGRALSTYKRVTHSNTESRRVAFSHAVPDAYAGVAELEPRAAGSAAAIFKKRRRLLWGELQ